MNSELLEFIRVNIKYKFHPCILPQDLWKSNWPWAPIIPNEPITSVILEELAAVDHLFVDHRANDKINSYSHEGWAALTLHGIDYDKTENYERYGFKTESEANYHWTSVCKQLPNTVELIKRLPFTNWGRVRIMRLAPNGYIMPHTDGTGRIFGPCNFALTNPTGCEFVFEGHGRVPFEQGRGFMLDLGIKHAVYNNSDQYRYHVIIHGSPNLDINSIVKQSIEKL